MNPSGWLQLAVFVIVLAVLTKPVGLYLVKVLDPGGKTFLDPVFKPVERLIYRILGVDPFKEQEWKGYAVCVVLFSGVGLLFTYAILRLQHLLPLNPQGFGPMSSHLAFNTASSFTTNTNWQSYGGESTLSYFSQMVGLTFHNFVSAAVGIAVAAALVRGITRDKAKSIGNFWADVTRSCLYLLLPLSLLISIVLVSQGMIQNFSPYVKAKTLEIGTVQTIAQGPMASQVAIKMLGVNGGGFVNANAAHPYENPTPLSNFIQMLVIFLIASGLTYYLGFMARNQRHGWSIWAAMFALFLVGALCCWWAEAQGNPRMRALGVAPVYSKVESGTTGSMGNISTTGNPANRGTAGSMGNMEGKEVRFGIFNSALFSTVTTDASCGAVNSMHDSFTPMGGLVQLFNMQLGEVVFGGVGAGLYGILIFVVLAIFLAGLMVGRTPEYLGKKIESYDIKVCALAILVPSLFLLAFTAWAAACRWGTEGVLNKGPHGLSEILYAFTSGIANNGSAFAGLSANTWFYNTTLGLAMLVGRFFIIIPVLALAGSLGRKKMVPQSAGSFPVSGFTFTALVIGTVIIVGALTFLPALSLGPVVEHFLMVNSAKLF
jgi:K+-transporting ATPase ATPase A chain